MISAPFEMNDIWTVDTGDFLSLCQKVYSFQSEHNPIYQQWIQLSKRNRSSMKGIHQIPFLPISFFKTHDVYVGTKPSALFESSGTTKDVVSKHWVSDLQIYEESFFRCFESFYGKPNEYCILGLLPSYLERKNSSLVYMVEKLIQASNHKQSGFYLNEFSKLNEVIQALESQKQKTWLIGVSFGLLDFCEAYPQSLHYTTVVETGGMKGRKEELTKQALHGVFKEKLGVEKVHSEYGMTELLSQAYSFGDGIYKCPPWMKVLVGDESDPTSLQYEGKGVLHVIDLANLYGCSFIATEDIGEVHPDGTFKILGRIDNSDRRGCSLLVI